jgi:ABC-type phosphate/phosphonate transport system substrate-binding protein
MSEACRASTLLIGAVAYDPKVVTIWEGFRQWLRKTRVDTDFVLYSNYERQVEDLLTSRIDLAWNSPLAWIRSRRLAQARGLQVQPLFMRDTDRDLRTAVVTRADAAIRDIGDLRGQIVAVGAVDSPQATLLPLSLLRSLGLDPANDFEVQRFDVGVGLHGDHIGGEREAVIALREGRVTAACVTDSNLLLFSREGTINSSALAVIAQTDAYDHCMMTVAPDADQASVDRLREVFLGMSYADPELRALLDLEGLTAWLPGRTQGYALLEKAVDEAGFYDPEGRISVDDYRP